MEAAIARILAGVEHIIRMSDAPPRRPGRPIQYVACPRCGASVTKTQARLGHGDGQCHRTHKKGRKLEYGPCRYCGATVTRTEWWKGHEGCTRVKRCYTLPGRRKAKPPEKEIVLNLTREEIARRIAAMPAKRMDRMIARLVWTKLRK